jgi:hypothetical protein
MLKSPLPMNAEDAGEGCSERLDPRPDFDLERPRAAVLAQHVDAGLLLPLIL